MKKIFFVLLILFSIETAYGAEWKSYSKLDGTPLKEKFISAEQAPNYFQIDIKSIVRLKNEKIRFWLKDDFDTWDGGDDIYRKKEVMFLIEINCPVREIKTLKGTSTLYDKDGNFLSTEKSGESSWSFIIPDSLGEILHDLMCKKK